jgi:hypothetical protein
MYSFPKSIYLPNTYGYRTNLLSPQCVVVSAATDIHPRNELTFLSGAGVDSVTIGECQHSSIIMCLLAAVQALNIKREGIKPSF